MILYVKIKLSHFYLNLFFSGQPIPFFKFQIIVSQLFCLVLFFNSSIVFLLEKLFMLKLPVLIGLFISNPMSKSFSNPNELIN